MGDKTQRLKGKANVVAGKTKGEVGHKTGKGSTEAKGVGQTLKGRAQETAGKVRKKL